MKALFVYQLYNYYKLDRLHQFETRAMVIRKDAYKLFLAAFKSSFTLRHEVKYCSKL